MKEHPKQYRPLRVGEIIEDGDQFLGPSSGLWIHSASSGKRVGWGDFHYRREIKSEKSESMKSYYYIRKQGGLQVQCETIESAQSEAMRLAQQSPGETFEILQCIALVSTASPTASTFWMEGQCPANK
jgi:hypothetical protein